MLTPDLDIDGWCLDCGEVRHADAPETFWIPDVSVREGLRPGDLAKLIFTFRTSEIDEPVVTERMWVIVRERTTFGYSGALDNDPYSPAQNEAFRSGLMVPFEPRHVIDAMPGA